MATGMQDIDEASPSIILPGLALLVKMLILLNRIVYFDQILLTLTFIHCLDTGMQNGDEASQSIGRAGHG